MFRIPPSLFIWHAVTGKLLNGRNGGWYPTLPSRIRMYRVGKHPTYFPWVPTTYTARSKFVSLPSIYTFQIPWIPRPSKRHYTCLVRRVSLNFADQFVDFPFFPLNHDNRTKTLQLTDTATIYTEFTSITNFFTNKASRILMYGNYKHRDSGQHSDEHGILSRPRVILNSTRNLSSFPFPATLSVSDIYLKEGSPYFPSSIAMTHLREDLKPRGPKGRNIGVVHILTFLDANK